MDHSPLPIKERMAAKVPEVIEFYHSLSRMINTSQLHKTMDSLVLKSDPNYVSDEKVSDAVKKAEEVALIKLREEADIREQQVIEAEAKKLAAEAEQKQIELIAKRDAKLKALQAETDRVEAQRVTAAVATKNQAALKAKRDAKIKALEAEKKKLLEEKDVINGKTLPA